MKKSKTKSDKEDKEQDKKREHEQSGSPYRDTDWKDDNDRFRGPRGDTW